MQTKTCTKCAENKPLNKFYKSAEGKYGRMSECIECKKIYRQKRKAKAKEEGLCYNCSSPTKNRAKRCDFCLEKERKRTSREHEKQKRSERWERKKKELVEANLCLGCKLPLDSDGNYCKACTEASNSRYRVRLAFRKDNNLCTECGVPLEKEGHEFFTCGSCRKRSNTNNRKHGKARLEQGLCRDCLNPGMAMKDGGNAYYCYDHAIYHMVKDSERRRGADDGSRLTAEIVRAVYGEWRKDNGEYVCAYTGYTSPNLGDFSIDHVYPIKLGGSHKKENLVLCEVKFNGKKSDKLWFHKNSKRVRYADMISRIK